MVVLTASGLAALGHQILWTRRLLDLLGASTESTVRVFVCFFLGLSLGAAFAAAILPRTRSPWKLLAGIEAGVAISAIPVITLPIWSGWLWPALGPEALVSSIGLLVKTGISVLLLLPPAFFMGMTLPLAVSAVSVSYDEGLRHDSVRLYAFNTVGGVLGLIVVAGFAIRLFGVPGSMWVLVVVNASVAYLCFRRSRLQPARQLANESVLRSSGESSTPFSFALVISGFSGAGVLALEVLALHLLHLSFPTSFYPPAAILFCVILLLAVAAFAVPKAVRRLGSPRRLIPLSLAAAGAAATLTPVILLGFESARLTTLGYADTFEGFLGKTIGVTLISLGPAMFFCGLAFPLAVSLCSGAGVVAGRKLGFLLAVNGLCGVAGAELARLLLMPSLGVHVAIGTVGIAYGLAAIASTLWMREGRFLGYAAIGLVTAILVTFFRLPSLPLFYWGEAYSVIDVRSGPEGVLTVFEREGFGRGLSFNNQYLLGSSGSLDDEQRQSHIPLLLHPAPERVCYAGLGTGITASGALRHSAVQSITAVELSRLVADAAAEHFAEFNGNLHERTNVVIHVEDALTYVAASENRFDVIIGDLFTPWRPGEAGLASLEFFQRARRALRQGGVFCQWFPMHQLTKEEFEIIESTFRRVFPEAYAFRNHLKTANIPLALIGFKDATLDWDVVNRRCTEEREAGRLLDPLCRHVEGVAMLYFGTMDDRPPTGPINTLANLRVELDAGLNLVVVKPGILYSYNDDGNPYLEFVRARRATWPADPSVPDVLRPLLEVGFLVSRLEMAYDVNHPATSKLERALRSQFPSAILSDEGADWALWAGNQDTLRYLRPSMGGEE